MTDFIAWFEKQVGPWPYGEDAFVESDHELREMAKSLEYRARMLRADLRERELLRRQADAAGWAWNAAMRKDEGVSQ